MKAEQEGSKTPKSAQTAMNIAIKGTRLWNCEHGPNEVKYWGRNKPPKSTRRLCMWKATTIPAKHSTFIENYQRLSHRVLLLHIAAAKWKKTCYSTYLCWARMRDQQSPLVTLEQCYSLISTEVINVREWVGRQIFQHLDNEESPALPASTRLQQSQISLMLAM